YYLTLETPGAIGEGMVFRDAAEAITGYQNEYVHLHTSGALYAGSLNKDTFTEAQNNQLLVTKIGKMILNEIIHQDFPYINEPTRSNLEEKIPDKYFLDKGTNVKEEIAKREVIPPFKKGILGDIIAEVFKR